MAKGYLMANLRVKDQDIFKEFSSVALPLIESFGGKLLARGPHADRHEGSVSGIVTLIEFESKEAAEKFGITILYHSIIYDLIDDVKSLLEGKLDPELRSTVTGMAEVLEVFKNSKIGNIAGCNVLDGKMIKGLHAKLLRDDVVIYDGLLSTLRRFKDDAKEVNAGQECGLSFDNNQDIRPGDKIECYKVDEIKRTI